MSNDEIKGVIAFCHIEIYEGHFCLKNGCQNTPMKFLVAYHILEHSWFL